MFNIKKMGVNFIYYEKNIFLIVKYINYGLTIFKDFDYKGLYTFFQRWFTEVDKELTE